MANTRVTNKEYLHELFATSNRTTKGVFDPENCYPHEVAAFTALNEKLKLLCANDIEALNPNSYEQLFIELAQSGYISLADLQSEFPKTKDSKIEVKDSKDSKSSVIAIPNYKLKLLKLYAYFYRTAAAQDFIAKLEHEEISIETNIALFQKATKEKRINDVEIILPNQNKNFFGSITDPYQQIQLLEKKITLEIKALTLVVKDKDKFEEKINLTLQQKLKDKFKTQKVIIRQLNAESEQLKQEINAYKPLSYKLLEDEKFIQQFETRKKTLLNKINEAKSNLITAAQNADSSQIDEKNILYNSEKSELFNRSKNLLSIIENVKQSYAELKENINENTRAIPSTMLKSHIAVLDLLLTSFNNTDSKMDNNTILAVVRNQYSSLLLWHTMWDNLGKNLCDIQEAWAKQAVHDIQKKQGNSALLENKVKDLNVLILQVKQNLIEEIGQFENKLLQLQNLLIDSRQAAITCLTALTEKVHNNIENLKTLKNYKAAYKIITQSTNAINPLITIQEKALPLKIAHDKLKEEQRLAAQALREKNCRALAEQFCQLNDEKRRVSLPTKQSKMILIQTRPSISLPFVEVKAADTRPFPAAVVPKRPKTLASKPPSRSGSSVKSSGAFSTLAIAGGIVLLSLLGPTGWILGSALLFIGVTILVSDVLGKYFGTSAKINPPVNLTKTGTNNSAIYKKLNVQPLPSNNFDGIESKSELPAPKPASLEHNVKLIEPGYFRLRL